MAWFLTRVTPPQRRCWAATPPRDGPPQCLHSRGVPGAVKGTNMKMLGGWATGEPPAPPAPPEAAGMSTSPESLPALAGEARGAGKAMSNAGTFRGLPRGRQTRLVASVDPKAKCSAAQAAAIARLRLDAIQLEWVLLVGLHACGLDCARPGIAIGLLCIALALFVLV
jgi:hypothetical protein